MSLPNPIVLLDARARYVHPAFQMTRASTKTVFDSTGKLVTVPANALGWDHDPATGQARGYLAEPSATNLLLHSNGLSESAWTKGNASITANAITGPDGNGMAKLVEDTTTNLHLVFQTFTITDEANVAVSVIAKAGEREQYYLLLQNSSSVTQNARVIIDLSTGTTRGATASNGATLLDSGVIDLGGGFYLAWLVGNLGAGVTNARVAVRLLDGTDGTSYTGDGTSGLYVGYCQAEEGSYPTSYIETSGATVARSGDSLIDPEVGNRPWWSSARGTVLIDVELPGAHVPGDVLCINNHDIAFRWLPNGELHLQSTLMPSTMLLAAEAVLGRHLLAIAWDEDQFAAAVDGKIRIDGPVSGALPPNPAVGLGVRTVGGAVGGGRFRRAVYYPARLSNADIQSLTAIQE